MPLLARMVATPVVIDVRRGVLNSLHTLLADQRISSGGRVAIVVGSTSGEAIKTRLASQLPQADWFIAADSTVDAAQSIADAVREHTYDAVVGIGGGRVLDVAKFVAARSGLPMVAVATNLAHDGIASPVSILDHEVGRGSYGVPLPTAVVVDLEQVREAPRDMVAAGIGDAISNLSAIADWQLSQEVNGEVVDGLAVTLARTAAEAVLFRQDTIDDDAFLVSLAEALIISGLAMSVSGTSRPCSGACHEISHAIDRLFPDQAGLHGYQVGVGAAYATWLRGDAELAEAMVACLRRHAMPVLPVDLGLSDAEFAQAVSYGPQTRPGRYTILEHLALDQAETLKRVDAYVAAFDR